MSLYPFFAFLMLKSLCDVIHLGSRLLVSWMVGARFTEVGLFIGQSLVEFRWRGVTWKLGYIPLGNYVKYQIDENGPNPFDLLPVWRRLLVYVSGVGSIALLACICLGSSRAFHSIGTGFEQLFMGLIRPGFARALVGQLYKLIQSDSISLVLGVVSAKYVAFNMIPLPPLDGWFFLRDLIQGKKWIPEQVETMLTLLGLIVGIILIGLWGYAFVFKTIRP